MIIPRPFLQVLLVFLLPLAVFGFSPQLTPTSTSLHVTVSTRQSSAATLLLAAQKDGDVEEPPSNKQQGGGGGLFAGVKTFFEELDAFVDDASARRLGNGAKFYGKRKSNFYGENDSMKKADKNVYDSEEDYRVTAAGNYKWMQDEDGVLRPVTRLKNKIVEKDP